MGILNPLNKILKKTSGFKVVKDSKKLDIEQIRKFSKPLYVEFVGASGVGKTTLFRKMMACRSETLDYLGPAEGLSLSRNKQIKMPHALMYKSLVDLKAKNIAERGYKPLDELKVMSFLYKKMNDVLQITANKDLKTVILFEDGLLHNFGVEIKTLLTNRQEQLTELLKNRIVLHCFTSAEQNAKRILQRHREGAIRPQHKAHLNNMLEMIGQQKEILKRKADFVYWLKETGLPVLPVNTENTSNSLAEIKNFINAHAI